MKEEYFRNCCEFSKEIGNHKGVTYRDATSNLPNPTERDKRDIAFGVKHQVRSCAPSFNTAQDVRNIRKAITDGAKKHCDEENIGDAREKFIMDFRKNPILEIEKCGWTGQL